MYKIKIKGIDECIKSLNNLEQSFQKNKYIDYIGDESFDILKKVTNQNMGNTEIEMSTYATNHKKNIRKNKVELYNDTMADISNMSEETQKNYPNGFSIAKAVEYGTGIVGKNTAIDVGENWAYDINNHGEKGWYYEKNGTIHWTKGMSGKFIFYKTAKEIEKKAQDWTAKYIEKNFKR